MNQDALEIIEFPYNKDRYLQIAYEHLQKQSYTSAIDYLDKALRIELDQEILPIFFELMLQECEAENGIAFFDDFKEQLLDPEQPLFIFITYYFEFLLLNEQFSHLEMLLTHYKQNKQLPIHRDELVQWQQRIATARLAARQKQQACIEEIKNQLKEQQEFSVTKQALVLQKLVSISEWALKEELIFQLLNDTRLQPEFRYPLLQEAATQSVESTILFKWFGVTKTIERKKLFPIEQHPLWQEEADWLEEYFEYNDIYFAQQLKELFYQDLLCLYPYIDETIKSYENWLMKTIQPTHSSWELSGEMHRGYYRFITT